MKRLHIKSILALGAAIALVSTANAVTKTYTQYGFTEVQNIEMDGLSSSTEITTTPQLAFPGVTLDDINQCTFISELYGGGVDTRATAWGVYPKRHKTNGSIDKLSLQFGVKDGTYTKVSILVLTNGDGGVYVQKYAMCYKSGTCLRYDFTTMDGSGNIAFKTNGDKPDGSDTTNGGGYQVWGIRIHGTNPVPEARLAFPGATLDGLKDCIFVAGYRLGNGLDNPCENNAATFITPWPSSDNIQKIVMQFTHPSESQKTAIIELTEGAGGVYARQTHAAYNGTSGGQKFVIDDSGNISLPSGTSGWVASGNGSYSVWDFYAAPAAVLVPSSESILLWTKKGGVLTLNDLAGASFSACMCGASVYPGGRSSFSNLYAEDVLAKNTAPGYNTREAVDANGDITEIVTEFQYNEPVNNGGTRCVVVKFTNGPDGVYGQAMAARYNLSYGYVFSDANGNYYGSGMSIATARSGTTFNGAYGVFDLKAVADTARIYRQGQTLTFGVNDALAPTSSTMIPYSAATVAFSGMTLEDLSDRVFFAYYGGGAIDKPGYRLAIHPALYPSSGDAEQLVTEIVSESDGGWHKASMLGLAYNANGAITVQKVQKTWSKNGGGNTCYFSFDEDGNLTYPSGTNHGNGNGYDIYGLQVFPGFVQTSPTLLFKGITLNDIENATFTARAGGRSLRGDGCVTHVIDRVNGYNKRVIKDGDDVTRILVEFQSETDWIKATIVEFTNGEGGVYGVAKEARYIGTSSGLGYQFVTAYDGTSITYAGNDSDPATSPLTGGYGVYDVQAAVEPDANEWTLDQNRNWSYYTGGEPIDDDGATIRVKVTGNGATLTIDENATVGRIVFVNAVGVDVTTNSLVIGTGVSANVGAIEAGAGAYVNVPASLGAATATAGSGSTIAYSGDGTVSGVLSGVGAVGLLSGRVTFSGMNDFTGGFIVKPGAVAVAGASVSTGGTTGPFGAISQSDTSKGRVIVEAGGMVDLNGHNGLCYRFTLAGTGVATGDYLTPGPIVNFGSTLDIGRLIWNSQQWTVGHAIGYALDSDVTLGSAGGDVGIVSESNYQNAIHGCTLDIGSYTLTKTGSGTLWMWAGPNSNNNTDDGRLTVTGNGTLYVADGVVDIRKGAYNGTNSTVSVGANGTLRIGAALNAASVVNNGRIEVTTYWTGARKTTSISGAYSGTGTLAVLSDGILTLPEDLSVYDFVNNGGIAGAGTLTVNGTLTAGNAIPKLTLADGATVKLTGTNAVQSVTGTFAAAGRVNVDASAVSDEDLKAAGLVPVLSAPSLPADIKQKMSAVGASNRRFRVVGEGGVSTVYMTRVHGFTVFVR